MTTACTSRALPPAYFCNTSSRYHGDGEFAEEDGSLYTGSWSGGKRSGQGSQVNNRERNEYHGSFMQDLYHGSGKCTWVNGSVYDGAWIRGAPNGIGVCEPTSNLSHYSIISVCDSCTFLLLSIRYVTADGSRIQGSFVNGLAHGACTRRYQNDDEYDQYNPISCAVLSYDCYRYTGEFDGGFRHGSGSMV